MTPEDQRIAVAKDLMEFPLTWFIGKPSVRSIIHDQVELRDTLIERDAIIDIIHSQDSVGFIRQYVAWLEIIVLGTEARARLYRENNHTTSSEALKLYTATAAQHTEAYLRAKDLWVPSSPPPPSKHS